MAGGRSLIIIALFALVNRVWAQDGAQHAGFLSDTCTVSDTVYTIVEQMPEFHGGEGALLRYFGKLTEGAGACVDEDEVPPSRTTISFVITAMGKVCDVRVANAWCKEDEEFILRTFRSMPDWSPGLQRGRPVDVKYTLPLIRCLSR